MKKPKIHKRMDTKYFVKVKPLCNQAIHTTRHKYQWKDVTCQNCLKQKPKEKPKKANREMFEIELLKNDLEHKKKVYDRYIDVLVEYNVENVAYSKIMLEGYIKSEMEMLFKNKGAFSDFFCLGKDITEKEKLESNIKHYDKLIDLIQNRIKRMTTDKKRKIVEEAIEKEWLWLDLIGRNNERKKNG